MSELTTETEQEVTGHENIAIEQVRLCSIRRLTEYVSQVIVRSPNRNTTTGDCPQPQRHLLPDIAWMFRNESFICLNPASEQISTSPNRNSTTGDCPQQVILVIEFW